MSVINQFDALNVKYSADPKRVYVLSTDGVMSTFEFDIHCVANPPVHKVRFFFNVQRHTAFIFVTQSKRHYICAVMRFHIQNDVPVMSANWLLEQDKIVSLIHDDFRQQYAAYLLDNIVNE